MMTKQIWLRENDPNYSPDQYADESSTDYEYGSGDEDPTYNENNGEGELSNLFDKPDTEDNSGFDDEDRYLVENQKPEYVDINAEDNEPIKEKDIVENANKKDDKSGYAEWKPREDYTPEQKKKINDFVADGYHPGDAEILARANRKHATMKDAVAQRVHPHEMSSKMHDKLKELANLHMNDIVTNEYSAAEPELNPQKATAGTIKSYNDIMQDFRDKKKEFEGSKEFSSMSPRERHTARKEWVDKYHKENPGHEEAMKQEWSKHGQVDKENWEKRKNKLEEDKQSIAQSGHIDTNAMGSLSSGSRQMARGPEENAEAGQTRQGSLQSAGISSSEEGGAPMGSILKDPHSTFADKNPELKAKYQKAIESSLDNEGKTRLKRINTIKGS